MSSYPASQQQPSAVGRSVVCKAYSDSVFGQLMGVRGTHNLVSFDLCIGNLDKMRQDSRGEGEAGQFFHNGSSP